MKIGKQFRKPLAIVAGTMILLIGVYILWQNIIPRYIASEVISDFEEACYSSNQKRMMELIYPHSGYYRLLQERGSERVFDEFKKFDRGFEITKTIRFFISTVPGDQSGKSGQIIRVYISKLAKKDGMKRYFHEIDLVRTDSEWKVLRFHFPDILDY